MLQKDLQTLGFSKNTAKVYLTLFEFGEAKAGQIVQNTGMHRNLVYRALEELEQKKMITRTQKSGVARFRILDPSHIMNELKEKENLAQHIIETLRTSYKENAQEVIVREGLDELQKFYIETARTLQKNDVWQLIGLANEWWLQSETFTTDYIDILTSRRVFLQAIVNHLTPEEEALMDRLQDLIEIHLNPEISFDSIEINILPNKVVICIFVEPFTIIEIHNKKFVDAYRAYFNTLWNQEVKTYHGWNEMEQLYFHEILPSLSHGDTEYVIAGGYDMPHDRKRFENFFLRYNTQGVKQGFEKYFVIPEKHVARLHKEMRDSGDTDGTFGHIRGIPMQHGSPLEIYIYKDRAVLAIWGDEPSATVYTKQKVIDGFKKQFDVLWSQEAITYLGWEHVEELFLNHMIDAQQSGDTEYVIGAGYDKTGDNERFAQLFVHYNTKLAQKGVHKQIIIPEKHAETLRAEIETADNTNTFAEIKPVSNDIDSPFGVYILNDYVVTVVWSGEPTATMYKRKDARDGFKKQFDYLWNQTVQTYTGWEELRSLFFDTILPTMKSGMKEYVMASGYDIPEDEYNQQQFAQFFLDYNKKGVKQGFEKHATICEKYRTNITEEMKNAGDTGAYAHIRFIPDEHASPLEIHIFPNRVVLIAWKGVPTATVYTREDMREGFLKQFEVLWKLGKE